MREKLSRTATVVKSCQNQKTYFKNLNGQLASCTAERPALLLSAPKKTPENRFFCDFKRCSNAIIAKIVESDVDFRVQHSNEKTNLVMLLICIIQYSIDCIEIQTKGNIFYMVEKQPAASFYCSRMMHSGVQWWMVPLRAQHMTPSEQNCRLDRYSRLDRTGIRRFPAPGQVRLHSGFDRQQGDETTFGWWTLVFSPHPLSSLNIAHTRTWLEKYFLQSSRKTQ